MRYVVALGGNAIEDKKAIGIASSSIAKLYLSGNEVIVTHGNGPQVGELAISQKESLAVLTAQTEAWIGITIEQSIAEALRRLRASSDYSIPQVVLTKTIVDKNDPAFKNPTKPIGRFYTRSQSRALERRGFTMKKLINGYRRVVPSPMPKEIVQKGMISALLKEKRIVIACGGGGIPMIRHARGLEFAEAVIDKDRASGLLARQLKADKFLILTNVDGVYLNFKRKDQRFIRKINASGLRGYLKSGKFEEGSIKPKIESCIDFAESMNR